MQTRVFGYLSRLADDFLDFFYPEGCACCGRSLQVSEKTICWKCASQLPFTGYERWKDNPVMENLACRIPLENAWALLDFKKDGIAQKLLHHLKYDRMPQIGHFLGRCAALKAREAGIFTDIDYAVPVPIHPKKMKQRGYNQCECILNGLEGIPRSGFLPHLLEKNEMTQSQTRKDRVSRWENVNGGFSLNGHLAQQLPARPVHLLLVDDVITTGATLESCCRELMEIPQVRITVMAIASPM